MKVLSVPWDRIGSDIRSQSAGFKLIQTLAMDGYILLGVIVRTGYVAFLAFLQSKKGFTVGHQDSPD